MPTQSQSQTSQTWKYLGFNYASWWNGRFANQQSTEALQQMSGIGADTSTIVATSFMDSIHSSEIYATQQTESLANVEKAIVDSQNAGLQVWLKPHIDTVNYEFRGRIDPSDRDRFFQNYTEYLLDYAHLAQQHNVEALVIGTELNSLMKSSDREYWLDTIDAVKQVYDGKITYAANWDMPDNIPFVEALDFIGIDAYYPLTHNSNASVSDLVHAWTSTPEDGTTRQITGGASIVDWLEGVSEAAGKPIVFTELGFRSLDGTAARPYEYDTNGSVDFEEQARLYEAFFQVFGNESWFDGVQLWNWYATEYQNNDPTDKDYPILDKPAEDIFRRYASQLLSESNSGNPPAPTPPVAPTPPTPPTVPEVPTTPEVPNQPGDGNSDALDMDFVVTNDWGDGFTGEVKIENTSTTSLQDWTVEFVTDYAIADTWNANIESLGGNRYRATASADAPWNVEVQPGETLEFGFVGNAATPSAPTGLVVTVNDVVLGPELPQPEPPVDPTPPTPPTVPEVPTTPEVPEVPTTPEVPNQPGDGNSDALDMDFVVTNDWGDGFTGEVKIENTSATPLQDWTVEFVTDYAIADTWNANIESLGGDRYRATASADAPWNAEIQPGETLDFGFVGNAATPSAPTGLVVTVNDVVLDPEAPQPEPPVDPTPPTPPTVPEVPTTPEVPEVPTTPEVPNQPGDGNSDAFDMDFVVIDDWGDGFSGNVNITNTSTLPLEDWSVEFVADYNIGQTWNANIESLGGNRYRATASADAPWNAEIQPGETLDFGFVGLAATPSSPSDYQIVGSGFAPSPTVPAAPQVPSPVEPEPPVGPPLPSNDDVEFGFQVTADWGGGFSSDILITNQGDSPISDWSLSFDTSYTLGNFWNADITLLSDGRYQAQPTGSNAWNAEIAPGETVTLGFVGNAEDPLAPIDLELTADDLTIATQEAIGSANYS